MVNFFLHSSLASSPVRICSQLTKTIRVASTLAHFTPSSQAAQISPMPLPPPPPPLSTPPFPDKVSSPSLALFPVPFYQQQQFQPSPNRSWKVVRHNAANALQNGLTLVQEQSTTPTSVQQPDQVLVRVLASSVSAQDIAMISGGVNGYGSFVHCIRESLSSGGGGGGFISRFSEHLPLTPGRDFVGAIVARGRSVAQFKPGDLVWGAIPPSESGGSHTDYVVTTEKAVSANLSSFQMRRTLNHMIMKFCLFCACRSPTNRGTCLMWRLPACPTSASPPGRQSALLASWRRRVLTRKGMNLLLNKIWAKCLIIITIVSILECSSWAPTRTLAVLPFSCCATGAPRWLPPPAIPLAPALTGCKLWLRRASSARSRIQSTFWQTTLGKRPLTSFSTPRSAVPWPGAITSFYQRPSHSKMEKVISLRCCTRKRCTSHWAHHCSVASIAWRQLETVLTCLMAVNSEPVQWPTPSATHCPAFRSPA